MIEENQPGRPREYRNLIMKLFVENKKLSINDIIDKLPTTQRKCKSCNGVLSANCKKCKDGHSKPLYYVIFREIKVLESENYLEQVEEITQRGKPELKYDLTTDGVKLIIDNDQTLDTQKFGNMLLSRASEDTSYKFKYKSSKKEKELVLIDKPKRDIGFDLNEIIKYYETEILKVSREHVFSKNTLKNINRVQYFTNEELDVVRTAFPLLDIICKKQIISFESIYNNVKLDLSTTKFNKLFLKLASMGLLITFSTNDSDYYSLSFNGLFVLHLIVNESNNKTSLKHIQNYAAILLPRLFSKKIFSKLSSNLDVSDLFEVAFYSFFLDKSQVLFPIDKNSDICLRLANGQESLISSNHSKISVLYMQLLYILDAKIQEKFPNFHIVQSDKSLPRIHRIFRDLFYLGYRTGKDSDGKITNEKLLSTIKKSLAVHKINFDDYLNIMEKYQQYFLELLAFDLLINGDDIVKEQDHRLSINELGSQINKIGTVIEYKVGLFLKFRYPKRFESIVNSNEGLLSWWNTWNNQIIEFEKQNASSLEQMIIQEVN